MGGTQLPTEPPVARFFPSRELRSHARRIRTPEVGGRGGSERRPPRHLGGLARGMAFNFQPSVGDRGHGGDGGARCRFYSSSAPEGFFLASLARRKPWVSGWPSPAPRVVASSGLRRRDETGMRVCAKVNIALQRCNLASPSRPPLCTDAAALARPCGDGAK